MHRLTRIAVERPALVVGVLLVATLLLSAGIPRLESETGYRAYLGARHPSVRSLDQFVEGFGGGLPMAAVWSCRETPACEDVFDAEALQMAGDVAEKLESAPGVVAVQSPATTRLFLGSADGMGAVAAEDAADLEAFREAAVRHPLWRGQILSADARVGAIVVQLASSDSLVTRSVLEELRGALAPYEQEQGFEFHIVGQAAQFAMTDDSLARDSQRLLPITLALVSLVVLFLFRTWQPVIAVLATVGLSTLWTLGTMGLLGWPQNAITQTIPPLILVIAMGDAVHLLSRYERHRATQGATRRSARARALLSAARETGAPCLVTTLTTAAGFASFTVSGLESFVRFGVAASAGITAALLLTFLVVPLVMLWLPAEPVRAARASESWTSTLTSLVFATRRHATGITVGALVAGIVCAYGVSLLRVDVDEYKLYGEQSAVVRASRFLEAHLRPPDSLELEVTLPRARSLQEPGVVERLTALSADLSSLPALGGVRSLLDAMRWANQTAHDGRPEFFRLGQTPGENAQILTLLALKDPASLASWAGLDFRRLRFSVEADKVPHSQRGVILDQVAQVVRTNLGPDWQFDRTGSFVIYQDLVSEIHRTQLASFAVAAFVVFVVLCGFLRAQGGTWKHAVGWGTAGIFTTVLPVVMTLGVMGFAGIHLDMGTAMVAAIIIGIAVDDAVHLLSEFQRRRLRGDRVSVAIQGAVLYTGRAVVTTSLALAAGFFVLLLSSWQSISSFGFLSGIAVAVALIAALVVLPALVCIGTGDTDRNELRREPVRFSEKRPNRRIRAALTLLVMLPTIAVFLVAARGLGRGDVASVLPCRIAPNGAVPIVAGSDPRCPLRSFDRVHAILGPQGAVPFAAGESFWETLAHQEESAVLEIERDGRRRELRVPIVREGPEERLRHLGAATLVAIGLLGFGLWMYWHSGAAAAPALLLLAGGLTVESITILCASYGPVMFWAGLPSGPFIVAALGHLALTFPREHRTIRRVPSLTVLPYVAGTLLAIAELRALHLDPTLWELSQLFLLAFAGVNVLWLCWASFTSLRDSTAPLEKARARELLGGLFVLPLVVLALWQNWAEDLPGGHLAPLLGGSGIFLLVLGHAIVRYDLFDVTSTARRRLSQAIHYLVLAIVAVATAWGTKRALGLEGPVLWALAATTAAMVTQGLRRKLLPLLEELATPWTGIRQRLLREQVIQDREMVSAEVSAQLVGQTIQAGLNATGIAIFLRDEDAPWSWRPVYVGGESPAFRVIYARLAKDLLKDTPLVHLARGDSPAGLEAESLWGAGVELALALEAGAQDHGMILVGRPRDRVAYRSEDLAFARAVAANAALAIQYARAVEEKLTNERRAAVAHLLRGIAHDLGRPLRVIERRADRIVARRGQTDAAVAEAAAIAEVSRHVIKALRTMAAENRSPARRRDVPLEDVLDRAIRQVDDSVGHERFVVSLAPGLSRMTRPAAEKLVRVLANLLANAVQASRAEPVRVYASREGGEIGIEIEDRGNGMAPDVLGRAFDLYFTTRGDEGGSGIGLALAREMVEDLGGKVELSSTPGEGTRAIVRIPVSSNGGGS